MIKERMIERDEQGNYYATNAITIFYTSMFGERQTFFLDPQSLYNQVYAGITKLSHTKDDESGTEEMRVLRKRAVAGMRVAIKGVLLMWGDSLLTLFYGTKNHPKPPKEKNLDLIDWYMHQFTTVAIAYAMRNDMYLQGQTVIEEDKSIVTTIDTISTRPVTPDSQATRIAEGSEFVIS